MKLFSMFKSKQKPGHHPNALLNDDELLNSLNKLGYFKYTAAEDMETVKNELLVAYRENNVLCPVLDEALSPKDYRLHPFDTETLVEDGVSTYLENMSVTFKRFGLKLEYSDIILKNKESRLYQEATINQKKYIIFDGNPEETDPWKEYPKNFALLLEDQLKLQGSDEKVFLISGGNDGQLIFLTQSLFEFIAEHYKDAEYKPYTITEWEKRSQW